MNSILGSLLLTTQSSVLLGFSVSICTVSCILCFTFYNKFRHKSLLYLGLTTIAFQFMMIMYDNMPKQYAATESAPILKGLTHLSGALIVFFFYKLFTATFTPFPTYKFITPKFYKYLIATTIAIRIAIVIQPALILSRLLSFSNILFYVVSLILCFNFKATTRSLSLLRLGFCLGVAGLSLYPLIRTGIISSDLVPNMFNYILTVTMTVFSIISLIGALELGREYLDRAEKASIRNMARAFIQLRDLVNTPFQTIELSVQLLRLRNPNEGKALEKIENSLTTLRRVDAALAKYESSVDWSQTDNFIEIDPLISQEIASLKT